MDTQIDHAVGMPISLPNKLPPPVDALFFAWQEPTIQGELHKSPTDEHTRLGGELSRLDGVEKYSTMEMASRKL